MAARRELTLVYRVDTKWIAGTYYVLNIINALKSLPDNELPHILLLHDVSESIADVERIGYPYISYQGMKFHLSLWKRVINQMCQKVHARNLFRKIEIPLKTVYNLYPCPIEFERSNVKQAYFWIPDLQERHLPHFFDSKELKKRDRNLREIIKSNCPIVFSSENSLGDFKKFYDGATNEVHIIRFVSIIDKRFEDINIEELKKKYNISGSYFIAPNQFWIHKNHKVVLQALKILKEKGIEVLVVFTGKEYDFRSQDYFSSLKEYVAENKLDAYVKFLGFIDRNEQLKLMQNAKAIIQPSLFEGWSTVVEDAKSLNKYIMLSDIALHKEQINENCSFFDPNDPYKLAQLIEMVADYNEINVVKKDYNEELKLFARSIIKLIR